MSFELYINGDGNINKNENIDKNKIENENKNVIEYEIINEFSEKKFDFEKIISNYHSICISLPKLKLLSPERNEKTEQRFYEMKKVGLNPYETFCTIFEKMQNSDFCNGMNERGWKADFDFVLCKNKKGEINWINIYEGKYDNRPVPKKLDTWERNQLNMLAVMQELEMEEQIKNNHYE